MADRDRTTVARLARAARGGLISVADAARALGEPRTKTAKTLARLAKRGWIERAKRGLYHVRPLEVEPGERTIAEDGWTLAQEAYSPCYIGGWSAAEHWHLTEQIFRSTLVVTAAHVRSRFDEMLGHTFRLFRVDEPRVSGPGLTSVWRGGTVRVAVSSPERTIADCMRSPELCGGVRHLADMLREYGRGDRSDFDTLADVMREVATGAAWKRLGYLAEELWPEQSRLIGVAERSSSAGNARLDPAVERRGRLVGRWGLWANVDVAESGERSS